MNNRQKKNKTLAKKICDKLIEDEDRRIFGGLTNVAISLAMASIVIGVGCQVLSELQKKDI